MGMGNHVLPQCEHAPTWPLAGTLLPTKLALSLATPRNDKALSASELSLLGDLPASRDGGYHDVTQEAFEALTQTNPKHCSLESQLFQS